MEGALYISGISPLPLVAVHTMGPGRRLESRNSLSADGSAALMCLESGTEDFTLLYQRCSQCQPRVMFGRVLKGKVGHHGQKLP